MLARTSADDELVASTNIAATRALRRSVDDRSHRDDGDDIFFNQDVENAVPQSPASGIKRGSLGKASSSSPQKKKRRSGGTPLSPVSS